MNKIRGKLFFNKVANKFDKEKKSFKKCRKFQKKKSWKIWREMKGNLERKNVNNFKGKSRENLKKKCWEK